jgi:hypothetical protein
LRVLVTAARLGPFRPLVPGRRTLIAVSFRPQVSQLHAC